MEPRPSERGNVVPYPGSCWPYAHASMSHVLANVGMLPHQCLAQLPRAEVLRMEPRPCERGNMTTPVAVSPPSPVHRFNGATSLRTWKLSRVFSCLEDILLCFNGATSLRTWKRKPCHHQPVIATTPPCFNGATSLRTWKPKLPCIV